MRRQVIGRVVTRLYRSDYRTMIDPVLSQQKSEPARKWALF